MDNIYICIKPYRHISYTGNLYEITKGTQFFINFVSYNSHIDIFDDELMECYGTFYNTEPYKKKEKVENSWIRLSKREIEEHFYSKTKMLIHTLINL